MNDNVIQLHGIGCSKCSQPALSHNFRTGQTIHLCRQLPHCQTDAPRPIPTPVGGES